MITYLILSVMITIVGVLFSLFPVIDELPWGMDSVLSDGVGGYKLLAEAFPPLNSLLTVFMIYLAFRLGIITLRFFLGNRTPVDR